MKYKKFSTQLLECKENGNLFRAVDRFNADNIILVCIKHLDVCSSCVCKLERTPCDNECHYHPVYGFVPEADCPVHDRETP